MDEQLPIGEFHQDKESIPLFLPVRYSPRTACNLPYSYSRRLALELERLSTIFGTADALEGLSALIEGRRAVYSGE